MSTGSSSGGNGWQLTASVANGASVDYTNQRPHRRGDSMFGLVLLRSGTKAELRELTADFRKAPPFLEPRRIEPPFSRVPRPGMAWRGTISGSTVLRKGSLIWVLFGRFARASGVPGYVTPVTDRALRVQARAHTLGSYSRPKESRHE